MDACIENRCSNDLPRVDDAVQTTPPMQIGSLCLAPGCCYTSSDCADGNRLTIDTCVKTGTLQGPNVKGSCSSR